MERAGQQMAVGASAQPAALRGAGARVLLVSASPAWERELGDLLRGEGYVVAGNDRSAVDGAPDLAVVDLALVAAALEAVADLRARTSMPILALTAEPPGERVVLAAYEAGVDQIVARAERTNELLARIRVLLRHRPTPDLLPHPGEVHDRHATFDFDLGVAVVGGRELLLSRPELALLSALALRSGRVVSRQQLSGHGGGVDSIVRSIRKKLEAAGSTARIVAVRGVGFRLLEGAATASMCPPMGTAADRWPSVSSTPS